jgi:predicted phage-related endonuclease
MRIIECEQGSPEWLQARLGIPSASSYAKLVTTTGKASAQATAYINQLVAERITGEPTFFQVTDPMQRGMDLEPQARTAYEMETGNLVSQVGFLMHDTLQAGASPDGMVGENGGLEIKCPSAHTHVEYLRDGDLPIKYFQQVQGCLWISGRDWWDFMSYHPKMEPLIVRVFRDEEFIRALECAVIDAVKVIEILTMKFRSKHE